MIETNLTGNYRVRVFKPAFDEVQKLCPRIKDRMVLRRHALKLRYWPQSHPTDDAGRILDLDWSWIRSLPGLRVGELRIDDVIGGNDNLRIIFYVGSSEIREPLPMIWVLRAMQKKREEFTTNDISIFRARRALVIERFERA